MRPIRVAILDLYDSTPNQGMRCIREIVEKSGEIDSYKVFDVRGKGEVPGEEFDIYISTGGPGSPHDGNGVWEKNYFNWLDEVWEWNHKKGRRPKHVFFICHSFQMACIHFKLGEVVPRRSMSFGIFPVHLTDSGAKDPNFDGLPNPMWAADFREWQVIQPDPRRFKEIKAEILALEKIRPHVPLERAIMAIRFSDTVFGTQFHPEADPEGMLQHFIDPARRKAIIETHSEESYDKMIYHLHDSDKLSLTHELVLPLFLFRAVRAIRSEMALSS